MPYYLYFYFLNVAKNGPEGFYYWSRRQESSAVGRRFGKSRAWL